MSFIIQHLDENTFLERASDRQQAIWFTPYRNKALVFDQVDKAESTVRTFNYLASRELQVIKAEHGHVFTHAERVEPKGVKRAKASAR